MLKKILVGTRVSRIWTTRALERVKQYNAKPDGPMAEVFAKCWANQHWPCRGGTAVNTFVRGPSRKFLEISQDMAAVANAPVQGPMKFQKEYAGVLSALGGLRFGNNIKSVDPIVWG